MIKNLRNKSILSRRKIFCRSVLKKSFGLMFSLRKKDFGLVFVFNKEQHFSLHMWFVFYPIDVIFLDKNKRVIEIKSKFRPFAFYTSKLKAKYFIELPSGLISSTKTRLGDKISF